MAHASASEVADLLAGHRIMPEAKAKAESIASALQASESEVSDAEDEEKGLHIV